MATTFLATTTSIASAKRAKGQIFNTKFFRQFLSLLMYRRGLGAFSVIHRGNHGNECVTTATAVVQNGHDEGKSGCGLRDGGEDGEEVEKVEEQKYSLRETEKRIRRQFNQSSVEGKLY